MSVCITGVYLREMVLTVEGRFDESKEETRSVQASSILNDSSERRDDAPSSHHERDVN